MTIKKISELSAPDASFLGYLAKVTKTTDFDLFFILYTSDSGRVEEPLEDADQEDLNAHSALYDDYGDGGFVRRNRYGQDFEWATIERGLGFSSEGRLRSLTVDLGCSKIINPQLFLKALVEAIDLYGGHLLIESLCLCGVERDVELSEFSLEIKLPYLRHLILKKLKFSNVNFYAAPRLESLVVMDSGVPCYDLTHAYQIKEISIGDVYFEKLILPKQNFVEKVFINKDAMCTVRDRNLGRGVKLEEVIENVGFSIEELKVLYAGVSSIDLSSMTKLQALYLTGNPLKDINLNWLPRLKNLDLNLTGVDSLDVAGNKLLKSIHVNDECEVLNRA